MLEAYSLFEKDFVAFPLEGVVGDPRWTYLDFLKHLFDHAQKAHSVRKDLGMPLPDMDDIRGVLEGTVEFDEASVDVEKVMEAFVKAARKA